MLSGLDEYAALPPKKSVRERNALLVQEYREATGDITSRNDTPIKILLGAYLMMLVEQMPNEKASLLVGLEEFLRADPREWSVQRDLRLFSAYLE